MSWYGHSNGLNSIRISLGPTAAGAGTIDHGDGTSQPFTGGGNQETYCDYAAPGTYTLTVTDANGAKNVQEVKVTGTRAALDSVAPLTARVGGPDVQVVYTGAFAATRKIIWNGKAEPTVDGSDPTQECSTIVKPSTASGPGSVWTAIEDADGSRTEAYEFTFTAAPPPLVLPPKPRLQIGRFMDNPRLFDVQLQGAGRGANTHYDWGDGTSVDKPTHERANKQYSADGTFTVTATSGVINDAVDVVVGPTPPSVTNVSRTAAMYGDPTFTLTIVTSGGTPAVDDVVIIDGIVLPATQNTPGTYEVEITPPLSGEDRVSWLHVKQSTGVSESVPFDWVAPTKTGYRIHATTQPGMLSGKSLYATFKNGAAGGLNYSRGDLANTTGQMDSIAADVSYSLPRAIGYVGMSAMDSAGAEAGTAVYMNATAFTWAYPSPGGATPGSPDLPAQIISPDGKFNNNGGEPWLIWDDEWLHATYVDANQITATIPAALLATARTVKVYVRLADGTRSPDADFVVGSPPPLPKLDWCGGATSSAVEFTIQGIANGAYTLDVNDGVPLTGSFDGTPVVRSHTYPVGAATYNVTLTDSASVVTTAAVKLVAARPTISTYDPSFCYTNDGATLVTVTGTNFDFTQRIYFDHVEVPTYVDPANYATKATFLVRTPLVEGEHHFYVVLAGNGARTDQRDFNIWAGTARKRSAKKSKK